MCADLYLGFKFDSIYRICFYVIFDIIGLQYNFEFQMVKSSSSHGGDPSGISKQGGRQSSNWSSLVTKQRFHSWDWVIFY